MGGLSFEALGGAGALGGTGRIFGRTEILPCSIGHRPLWVCCSKSFNEGCKVTKGDTVDPKKSDGLDEGCRLAKGEAVESKKTTL